MGAGVVKYPPPTGTGEEMSCCESCSVRFSVLKRKKICDECKHTYCAACAQKVPSQSSIRRCTRCTTLVNGNYSREDLHDFKAKELKQFLLKRDIPVHNCTEKRDFIELLLQYSNNTHYREEQAERERHLQTLQDRMRNNLSPTVPEPQRPTEPQRPPAYTELFTSSQTHSPNNPSIISASSTPSDVESPTQEETPVTVTEVPEMIQNQGESVEPISATEASTSEETSNPSSEQTQPVVQKAKFARLSDVNSLDEISNLSTRQLKEILAGNFVDYKGCVEKKELRQRVERLWKENQQNQSAAEDIHEKGHAAQGETELCKVCMDNVVDCVLLECGHMLTCTQCGKQLAECPICRQYIVRVVHVFKS